MNSIKKEIFTLYLFSILAFIPANLNSRESNLNQLSEKLLLAVKTEENCQALLKELTDVSIDTLVNQLNIDTKKVAFWLNIYNAFTQILARKDSLIYSDKSKFFNQKAIQISKLNLSLDEIEHGILRRSKIKWSLGYFNKLFPSCIEKQLRVSALDYRIHFALNCGAKSCPPIAFYSYAIINEQLDLSTENYLKQECEWKEGRLYISRLFQWFHDDFGGRKGIYQILTKFNIIESNSRPSLKYKDYNWDVALSNFN